MEILELDYSKRGPIDYLTMCDYKHQQRVYKQLYPDSVTLDDVIKLESTMSMTYEVFPKKTAFDGYIDWKFEMERWFEDEYIRLDTGLSPYIDPMFVDLVSGKLDNEEWMKKHKTYVDNLHDAFIVSLKKEIQSSDIGDYNAKMYR